MGVISVIDGDSGAVYTLKAQFTPLAYLFSSPIVARCVPSLSLGWATAPRRDTAWMDGEMEK